MTNWRRSDRTEEWLFLVAIVLFLFYLAITANTGISNLERIPFTLVVPVAAAFALTHSIYMLGWRRALATSRQRELAQRFVALLGIKAGDIEAAAGTLSGGNQQKVVLARWLATAPRLLILDEPTRGIDIAAKQEIMGEVVRLAREGMAVLFISAEIEELTRLGDRIAVMRDRHLAGERYLLGICEQQNAGHDEWMRYVRVERLTAAGAVQRVSIEAAADIRRRLKAAAPAPY